MSANLSAQPAPNHVAAAQHRACPPPSVVGDPIKSLLADWFPVRHRLCDLRSKDNQTDREAKEVYQRLSELVDIADDIVALLVPDADARTANGS